MTKAVPQYPRPVPCICTDEAPICSDTVVYERWTDEAEREERKRAAKRRRTIADAAASYLRGEPLFILTASLQGPFGDGWKNPWAKKRQKRSDGAEIAAAETAGVESAERKRLVPPTAGAAAIEHPPSAPEKRVPIDQVVPRPNQNLSTAKRHVRSPSASASRPDSSAEKVSDWLRKTEDLPPSTAENGQSSPTPGAKERLHPLSRSEYESAVAWRSDEAPAGQAALGQPFSLSAPCQSAGSEDESPRRAEAAIIEYKRRNGRRVPPSTHQPKFEYRRPRRRGAKADEAIHPESVAATAAQAEQSKTATSEGHSTAKPALSIEASNVHSAQVVAGAPRLAALPSEVHSTEDMLQSAPLVTPNENHTLPTSHAAEQQSVNTCESEKENDPAAEERCEPDQLLVQVNDEPTNSLEKTPVRELDTPEITTAVKPIDLSTAKKKPLNEQNAGSPTSSPRTTKDTTMLSQRRKKTRTQSVKASMKVTKASTTTTTNKADSASSAAKKLAFAADLDSLSHSQRLLHDYGTTRAETAAAAAAAAVAAPRDKSSNPSPPKGILKRISASAPESASASTSAKPDAQPVSAHALENALRGGRGGGGDENDDSFDLDLAMDELGSYLGTWDADVEAQKLLQ